MPIPFRYNRLMAYLIVPDAYQFIDFMKHVFAATGQVILPGSEGAIMHCELCIQDSVICSLIKQKNLPYGRRAFFL